MQRTSATVPPRRRGRAPTKEVKYGLLFALPAIVFFAGFYVYPLLWAGYISLQDWNLLGAPRFVGLANYLRLLSDGEFHNSLAVTFYYTIGTVVPIWVIALGLAMVLNRAFRFRQAFLAAFYLPAVVSLTVWSLVWLLMFNPSFGLLTVFTQPLGLDYVRWLASEDLAMPSLILLSIVKGVPVYMLIYLIGLRGIPDEYYEAARVDGANGVQRFWYVTLPLLRPIMLYVAVISIITAFQVFTPAYLLTQGGPGSATRVLPLFVYQHAFQYFEMGYASAASIVLFLLLMVLTIVQFRLLRSRT
ncbi:MAG: ABC transporter permease subunit [Streptosporangiales bacterium]|nr:ABC transporter permease subunit [Streptosporangiales bacterium]